MKKNKNLFLILFLIGGCFSDPLISPPLKDISLESQEATDWLYYYIKRTGVKTIPIWLRESSEEVKIEYLKYGTSYIDRVPNRYLSEKKEDSINVMLKKTIVENEKSLGRGMTELEKAKIEYEIQFGEQIPVSKYSDDTLFIVMKRAIKMNERLRDSVGEKDIAVAVYENKFNRPAHYPYPSRIITDKEFTAVLKRAVKTNTPPYQGRSINRFEITKAVYEEHFGRPIPNCKCSDMKLFAILINALRTNNPYNQNTKITEMDKAIAEYETHFNWAFSPKYLRLPVREVWEKVKSAIERGYADCSDPYGDSRIYKTVGVNR